VIIGHQKNIQAAKVVINKTNNAAISYPEKKFDWHLCFDADNLVNNRIDSFLLRNTFANKLSDRMRDLTGTLLTDWVDYMIVSADDEHLFCESGFLDDPFAGVSPPGQKYLWHPGAMLPRIIVDKAAGDKYPTDLAIRVDSINDFMSTNRTSKIPEGEPLTRFRRILASEENGARFEVVERRGYRGYHPDISAAGQAKAFIDAQQLWRSRNRNFADDVEGFDSTLRLIDSVIELVGRDMACHIIFMQERAYWESRNKAAQIQKQRQDRLGLGWANHDHHTFRSSRQNFTRLISAFEKLGFERRERYYAGAQAGWGAQIMEQPVEGIVVFCDVDLEPEETEIDFSRMTLPASKKLGTIGLWVALHGESFLDAGMHHLECRFDYHLLRDQLGSAGVKMMTPFSDFSFLRQAFTEGERWPVRRERAENLLRAGLIDEKQFNVFLSEGAIGSHLENLQRKGGFKGFNQDSVSVIIRETDPRKQRRDA
jgi:hypothetical protein